MNALVAQIGLDHGGRTSDLSGGAFTNFFAVIEHYNAIIEATDGVDPVTNDMMIGILHDEESHRRLFEGFLREYEAEGRA